MAEPNDAHMMAGSHSGQRTIIVGGSEEGTLHGTEIVQEHPALEIIENNVTDGTQVIGEGGEVVNIVIEMAPEHMHAGIMEEEPSTGQNEVELDPHHREHYVPQMEFQNAEDTQHEENDMEETENTSYVLEDDEGDPDYEGGSPRKGRKNEEDNTDDREKIICFHGPTAYLQAKTFMMNFERESNSKYTILYTCKTNPTGNIQALESLEGKRVLWGDNSQSDLPVHCNGAPFVMTRNEVYTCSHSHSAAKKKKTEMVQITVEDKPFCPARIQLKALIYFPEYKVEAKHKVTSYRMKDKSKKLKKHFSKAKQVPSIVLKVNPYHEGHPHGKFLTPLESENYTDSLPDELIQRLATEAREVTQGTTEIMSHAEMVLQRVAVRSSGSGDAGGDLLSQSAVKTENGGDLNEEEASGDHSSMFQVALPENPLYRTVHCLSLDGFMSQGSVKVNPLKKVKHQIMKDRFVRNSKYQTGNLYCPCGEDLSWVQNDPVFTGAFINERDQVLEMWVECNEVANKALKTYKDTHPVFKKLLTKSKNDTGLTGAQIRERLSFHHPEIIGGCFPFTVLEQRKVNCVYNTHDPNTPTCRAQVKYYTTATWYNTDLADGTDEQVREALYKQTDAAFFLNYVLRIPLLCKHDKHEVVVKSDKTPPNVRGNLCKVKKDIKTRATADKIHPQLYELLGQFIQRGLCDVSTIQITFMRMVSDNYFQMGLSSKPSPGDPYYYPSKLQLVSLIQEYSYEYSEQINEKDYYYKVFDNMASYQRYVRDFMGEQRCYFNCSVTSKQWLEGPPAEGYRVLFAHNTHEHRTVSAPFDGCPFISLGSQIWFCTYGEYFINKNTKCPKAKEIRDRVPKKDSSCRKFGCTANIHALLVVKYMNWKSEDSSFLRPQHKCIKKTRLFHDIRKTLKENPEALCKQNLIFAKFPKPTAHCSHPLFYDTYLPPTSNSTQNSGLIDPYSHRISMNAFDITVHPTMYVHPPLESDVRLEVQGQEPSALALHLLNQARMGHGCDIELHWGYNRPPVKAHSVVISMHSYKFEEVQGKSHTCQPARFHSTFLDEVSLQALVEFMYTGVLMFNVEDMKMLEAQCQMWQLHSALRLLNVYKVLLESGMKKTSATVIEECSDVKLNLDFETPALPDNPEPPRAEPVIQEEDVYNDENYLDEMEVEEHPDISVSSSLRGRRKKIIGKTVTSLQGYAGFAGFEKKMIKKGTNHYQHVIRLFKQKMKEVGAKRQWVLQLDTGEKVLVTEQTCVARRRGVDVISSELGYEQCIPDPPLENTLYMGEMTNYECQDGKLVSTQLLDMSEFYKPRLRDCQTSKDTQTDQTIISSLNKPAAPKPQKSMVSLLKKRAMKTQTKKHKSKNTAQKLKIKLKHSSNTHHTNNESAQIDDSKVESQAMGDIISHQQQGVPHAISIIPLDNVHEVPQSEAQAVDDTLRHLGLVKVNEAEHKPIKLEQPDDEEYGRGSKRKSEDDHDFRSPVKCTSIELGRRTRGKRIDYGKLVGGGGDDES